MVRSLRPHPTVPPGFSQGECAVLTLDDVLSIRHPEAPAWSADGQWIGFLYIVDGTPELWAYGPSARLIRVSSPGCKVGAWGWGPHHQLVYAEESTVLTWDSLGPPRTLARGSARVAELCWSPDRSRLAILADGHVTILGLSGPAPLSVDVSAPGRVMPGIAWSPESESLVGTIVSANLEKPRQAFMAAASTGTLTWQSQHEDATLSARFISADHVLVQRMSMDGRTVTLEDVAVDSGEPRLIHRETSDRGPAHPAEPAVSPDGRHVAYVATVDGWPHLLLWDRHHDERALLLPGRHEDVGHAHDRPVFSSDGRWLIFSSSHGGLTERHLWVYEMSTGEIRKLTHSRGTQVNPAVSPDSSRVAYLDASEHHSLEVAVAGIDEAREILTLTHSMPAAWVPEAISLATPVVLTASDGFQSHADLFLPKPFDPSRKYPALIYLHGGPMRQMRLGWHPMHPYAVFHAFNQYLLDRGYVVLSVDYRGGTGYGTEYEQANFQNRGTGDMSDVVAGAHYLKTLPYVDAERLGVWGLSYGGYLTLALLTKEPALFQVGVNIAGVWDFDRLSEFSRRRYPGLPNFWQRRLGGPLSDATRPYYHAASPAHFAEALTAPLYNFHGTDDEAVDFHQLDLIVEDLTRLHKDFSVMYYPGESHMFHRRATWEDAFPRMERAFGTHLQRNAQHALQTPPDGP